jgi:hypothetical protein
MQAVTTPFTKPFPPPKDKETLVRYITEAAMLEHQFMCQYLYAAFSLKKFPDDTCTPAQLEAVRRWASVIYTIARQEMEHFSIANSLLTAIGSPPWFGHTNFPTLSRWYQKEALLKKNLAANAPEPCDFPFLLQAFDLSVARRFCCMESPKLDDVQLQDRANVLEWCFEPDCGCVPELPEGLKTARSFVPPPDASANAVEPGTVQELYGAIASGLKTLNAELGSKALFNGHQSGQSEILMEYDIYLFPICNLETALAGIQLITRQGEGIDTPPGYDSHFQNYYDMAVEYAELLRQDERFRPSLALPLDPQLGQYSVPITRDAVAAFNDGYVAMLYMLVAYYTNFKPAAYNQPPYLFQALQETVFAPTMTMLIRSLAEVIVQLPADEAGGPAGPVFNLTPAVMAQLENPTDPIFLDIDFHMKNLMSVANQLENIINNDEPPPALLPKFQYICENVWRMVANLEYIYRNGTYPAFVNLAPDCTDATGCE